MTRTYARWIRGSRRGLKRLDHKHGHCWMCGYDPRDKGYKKTEEREEIKRQCSE